MLSLNMKKIKIKGISGSKLRQRGNVNPLATDSASSALPRGVKIVKGKRIKTSATEENENDENIDENNEAEEEGSESGNEEGDDTSEVEEAEIVEEQEEDDKEMKKRKMKDIQHTITSTIRSRLYESRYYFYYIIICILVVFYMYKSLLHRWQMFSDNIDKQYFDDDVKLDYAMRLLQAEQELIKELLDYDSSDNIEEESGAKSRNPKLIETYRRGFIEIVKNEVKEKALAQIRGIIDGLVASKACESSTVQKFRPKILQVVETMWNNIDKKSKALANTHAKVVRDNNNAILEKHKEINDFIKNGGGKQSENIVESKQDKKQEPKSTNDENDVNENEGSSVEDDNSATKSEGDDYAQENGKEDDS